MNQVLGNAVGNALEIKEALAYLQQKSIDPRLDKITRALCADLLCRCGRCHSEEEATKIIDNSLSSGRALEKFAQMASALGAPTDFVEKADAYLPQSLHQKPIFAEGEGFVAAMDTRAIGLSIIELGGGRTVPNQPLDLATGYTDFVQIGAKIDVKTPLAIVHYQTEEQYEKAAQILKSSVLLSDTKPQIQSPILLKL